MKKIVMCKNCKNYELMTCNNAHFCDEYGGYVTEEDFCSRGKPITNTDDHPTEKGGTQE